MSHCFTPYPVKARKNHTCTICGQRIHKGELYIRWSSVDDCFFDNKSHNECYDLPQGEYDAYEFERPDYRLTNEGLMALYRKWGWRIDKVENYQRPILLFGYL